MASVANVYRGSRNIRGDISWVDSANGRYYLSDKANRIDVIDTSTLKFLYAIPQDSTGTQFTGPNGVVAIPYLNQNYVGDTESTVKVVDLAAKTITATISTGGKARADELAYDPQDHIVMI